MILSQEEKDFINRMNDPVYKLSVVEGWLNYPLTNEIRMCLLHYKKA